MPRGYRDEDPAPRSRTSDEAPESFRMEHVRALKSTKKALLCIIDGEEDWIPFSQITDDSEVYQQGDEGTLIITRWLAYKKGLVGL
jgi:hypothetical protein